MHMPSLPELGVLLGILALLFGAKKIPTLGTSLGKGIRNFKKSITGQDDSEVEEEKIVSEKKLNKEEVGA